MSKSGKKPRPKLQAREFDGAKKQEKKEKDWDFEDIIRMKSRGKRAW